MAQTEIGGTAYFKINGQAYNVRAQVKAKIGGAVKTPVMGADGQFHGVTTKYVPGMITLTVSTGGQFSQTNLRTIAGDTCTLELGNGKTYILPQGTLVDDPEEDNDEGSMTFSVAGPPLQEILAGI